MMIEPIDRSVASLEGTGEVLSRHHEELQRMFRDLHEKIDSRISEAAAVSDWLNATLNLQEASRECGYSPDHLSRLVKAGKIPNHGRRNAPRVRRGDLPRQPGFALTPPATTSETAPARSALAHGGIER